MEVDVIAEVQEEQEVITEGYCELNEIFDKLLGVSWTSSLREVPSVEHRRESRSLLQRLQYWNWCSFLIGQWSAFVDGRAC